MFTFLFFDTFCLILKYLVQIWQNNRIVQLNLRYCQILFQQIDLMFKFIVFCFQFFQFYFQIRNFLLRMNASKTNESNNINDVINFVYNFIVKRIFEKNYFIVSQVISTRRKLTCNWKERMREKRKSEREKWRNEKNKKVERVEKDDAFEKKIVMRDRLKRANEW